MTMRSNKENPLDRRNPLFPLQTVRMVELEEEGAPRRLTEEAARGALIALNHLAGYECTQSSSQDEVAASATSSETSVRSLAEKGWWRSSFAIACGRFRIVLFHLVSFS